MTTKDKITCLVIDDEPLARDILVNYISRVDHLQLIACCANALEAFNLIAKKNIDLLFLDIEMPEITGTDFLKQLNNPPKVIFTTAYSNYAVDAFSLEASDYLLKPIEFPRFLKSIHKILKELTPVNAPLVNFDEDASSYQDAFIYLKVEKKMQKVFLREIHYIESIRNYIKIKTIDREIVALKSISNIEETLPGKKFLRVHRSFIVGMDFIDSFSPSEIDIKGVKIPVGRNYKDTVKEVLGYF
ncbi:LytR/AlgR family response regulator transcription factor [Aquimarina mytili]|uniref:Response regulator transcription factor n=1 Tax=Aquimarina mytili TaxID=874423 RepID=A0A936ZWQ5_9FLAO|nr:LytTR family DNA-binding domain-containing protein [Aquimarina mytili]MBL0682441.1 response regulator transcription factor [Aquimarina mytili]